MTFLGSLLVTLIAGMFFLCTAIAISSARLSGKESRDEEAGAPEGGYRPTIN
jgi:hypothetical protein